LAKVGFLSSSFRACSPAELTAFMALSSDRISRVDMGPRTT